MNAPRIPYQCDLRALHSDESDVVLWVDRSRGLDAMYAEAETRLAAAADLCSDIAAHKGTLPAEHLATTATVLVNDAMGVLAAHHGMAQENLELLRHYIDEMMAKASARQARAAARAARAAARGEA